MGTVGDEGRDVPSAVDYRVRTESGGSTYNETVDGGLSVRGLLERLGCNPASVQEVELRRVGQVTPVVLVPPAFEPAGANGYEQGLQPLFLAQGSAKSNDSLGFIRPLRAPDPADLDVNNVDQLLPQRRAIDVFVDSASSASVVIDGPARAVVGKPVQFTSTVAPTGQYDYGWNFGDGGRSNTPTPTYTFTKPGSWRVSLGVSGDSYGQSNVLTVVVTGTTTPPPPPPTPTQTATPDPRPPGSPTPGDGTGDENNPATGPNQDSDGQTGGAKPGPRPTDPGAPETRGSDAPDSPRDAEARRTPGAGEVRGVLLAGGRAVPVGVRLDAAAADAGEEPTAPTARASVPGAGGGGLWWGAGALPLLLLIGAVGETGLLATLGARLSRQRDRRRKGRVA